MSSICSSTPSPVGYSSPSTLATIGSCGGRRPSRCSVARSGALAGATISVWKAWLTGSGTAWWPRSCSAATT